MTTKNYSLPKTVAGLEETQQALAAAIAILDQFTPRTNHSGANVVLTDSTTLQSISGASVPIAANEVLKVDFTLPVGSLLASTGLKVAVDVPSGAALEADAKLAATAGSATISLFGRTTTDDAAITFAAASLTSATVGIATVTAVVINGSTAGTVQLQAAPATTGAALSSLKGATAVAQSLA